MTHEAEGKLIGRRVWITLWQGQEKHAGTIVNPPAGILLKDAMVCIQFDPPVTDIHNPNTWINSLTRLVRDVSFAPDASQETLDIL